MKAGQLDRKLSGFTGGYSNQTFREYLIEGSVEFGLKELDWDNVSDDKIAERLNVIDDLWCE